MTPEDGSSEPSEDAQPGPTAAGAAVERTSPLGLDDHKALLSGFEQDGFACLSAPDRRNNNPLLVDVRYPGGDRRFTIWAFRIEPGGGGSEVRSDDERRIQESNGPNTLEAMAADDRLHLLLGYESEDDVICVFDKRYIADWIGKFQEKVKQAEKTDGAKARKPSPSRQVALGQLAALDEATIRRYEKSAEFGTGTALSYIMRPAMLPKFLEAVRDDGTFDEADIPPQQPEDTRDVVRYCADNGYYFEADLIARYVASLAAKPFVILAGISGTGKSKLAELVAEFYARGGTTRRGAGAVKAPTVGRTFAFAAPGTTAPAAGTTDVALVPVRPDWLDNKSVLGFVNPITGAYESTATLDIILRAAARPDDRLFLILDEMNLAKVEHYFSDWLACTESRRYRPDGTIHQQGVPLHRGGEHTTTKLRGDDGNEADHPVPGTLLLPTNLAVTGTVNVDESTHGFSPKVLDRAMVIEFDAVDLDGMRPDGETTATQDGDYRFPQALPDFRIATSADYAAMPASVHGHVVAINRILEKPRLHVGYRAATEMALFMSAYNAILPEADVDGDWLKALDAALLQKVLPRIGGNRVRLERALAVLCHYLRDLEEPAVAPARAAYAPNGAARLPRSYHRVLEMWDTLIEFGYVSFFK